MQRWHRGGRRAFGPSAKVMSADPEIEETVAAAVAASLVPGLALALVEDGGVSWAGGFGVRNAAGSDPIDADTIFAVASLSKPPFAYLVLKLAASVDARTRSFLAHTSGIGNWDEGGGEPGTWRYSGEGDMQLQRGHRGSVRETAGCDRRNRALQAARTRANELRVERRVAEHCRRPRHLVDWRPPLPRAVERVQPAHKRARVRALGRSDDGRRGRGGDVRTGRPRRRRARLGARLRAQRRRLLALGRRRRLPGHGGRFQR